METPILISGGYDTNILFWNALRGEPYKQLPHHDCHVNCLDVKNDMNTVAVGGNPLIRFYDLHASGKENPQPIVTYEGHTANVTSLGFENRGRWFFSGSEDATVKLWDCRCTGYQLFHDNSFAPVHAVVLHPNQVSLIICDQKGRILFWDLKAHKISQEICPERGVALNSIAISPDVTTLAAASSSGLLHIYNVREDEVIEPMKKVLAHNGQYVLKCRFSPESQYLATTSSDSTCSIWKNGPDGLYKGTTISGHSSWVWDCAFSNDSSYILTASSDSTCKLWDISTGQQIIDYIGHAKAITSIALLDFPQQDLDLISSEYY